MINIDYITAKFPKGRLTILAGRPFVGKTAFVLSIARVLNAGLLYLSLKEEAFKVVETVKLQEQKKRLLKRWSFSICDIPGLSIEELECIIKKQFSTIIINYVELMNVVNDKDVRYEDRNEEKRLIYERLDHLAKKYNCRIIGISMLGRFKKPEVPRFEEYQNFLAPSFINERLIILHRPSEYAPKQQTKTTDYIELISKNQDGKEVVDRFSIDKKTQSVIRMVNRRAGDV